jgi:hypothetical protein
VHSGACLTVIADTIYAAVNSSARGYQGDKRLQAVAKLLAAHQEGLLHPESPTFYRDWTMKRASDPSHQELFDVLLRETRNSPLDTVNVVQADDILNFFKLMCRLLPETDGWNMLNLNLLQCMDQGLKSFKDAATRWLIETARLFASPQLPGDEPWWHRARFPIMSPLIDSPAGRFELKKCDMIAPKDCHEIHAALMHSLNVNECQLDRDWDAADGSSLARYVCRIPEPVPGLTTMGAVTALGVWHRLRAGVPVLLVSDGRGAMTLDQILQLLASMLRIESVTVDLVDMGFAELEERLAGAEAKLLNLRFAYCAFERHVELMQHALRQCVPLGRPADRRWVIGTIFCSEDDVRKLEDTFRSAIVFWAC